MNALDAICATPLDKTSDVPLYLQLKLRLMGLIATHAFDGQTPLPAEADICRALNLSRSTVRRCGAARARSSPATSRAAPPTSR